MAEYIELINSLRQEAEFEAYLQPHSANETPKLLSKAADVIDKLSKERKKGEWIQDCDYHFHCSVCGDRRVVSNGNPLDVANGWNYCPNCGADMRGNDDGI